MLLLPAIELLALLDSGAGMKSVAEQELFNLAVGFARREEFQRYL